MNARIDVTRNGDSIEFFFQRRSRGGEKVPGGSHDEKRGASMLIVRNDGKKIIETNFWDSPMAQAGYAYLSWNAGAARLLLPNTLVSAVNDMRAATQVIVSRGPWIERGGREAVEVLFDDDTDAPFSICLAMEQTDRRLPACSQGGGFSVDVWTRTGCQASIQGKYREVAMIPCLEPWQDH